MGNRRICADICTGGYVMIVVAAKMDARGGRKCFLKRQLQSVCYGF